MNKIELQEKLFENQDLEYKKFNEKLIPGREKIIGVRMPVVKKIAREIVKSGQAEEYLEAELDVTDEYYEETLIQGLLIGNIKTDPDTRLDYLRRFILKIDNWAVCDSVSGSLKFTQKNMELVWDFLMPYLDSHEEYDVRFAAVMLMDYYIDNEHIDRVIDIYDKISHEAYYVKMAVAWGLSFCFIKYPDKTMKYLKKNDLDDWTYNKTIQKIIESRRVDDETKDVLRSMKRKKK